MRTIERTGQFKRYYRRESRGRHGASLDSSLGPAGGDAGQRSSARSQASRPWVGGEWRDHRDCHVKPDLVLIYQKPDAGTLRLVRLGSHSEPGL